MPIESGPTGERKVRSSLLFLMVLVFGFWFAYDGWIGYPGENYRENLEQLPADRGEANKDIRVYKTVNEESSLAANQLTKKYRGRPETIRSKLESLFGGPPSFETKDTMYYFGPAYRVTIPLDATRSDDQKVVGRATEKSATDILFQKGLGIGLLIFAAYLLVFVLRVRGTRLVLNEAGLQYCGRGPISWEAMRELDISKFSRKGHVDLVYDDNGSPRRLRLDEYHLEKFDEVIDEICARKGFENPLPTTEEPAAGS
ncbi:MAG TPA: hypothetical protein VJZ71_11210 [Phycisphaerae bacterium]|nr:hypothetical protein [Phycisphaerae bacterium]